MSEGYATIVVKSKRSLEFVDVVKDFSGLRVVDRVSFQGTVTGLIGPNGGDKTALGRWTRAELPLGVLTEQLRHHWCSPRK